MSSTTLRRIYRHYYGVEIGPFARGAGIQPGIFHEGLTVGAFTCIAEGLVVERHNHPTRHRLSQHPVFFSPILKVVPEFTLPRGEGAENPLRVGHAVWIGTRVIICPGCHKIGDGAIVGAGAVVTRDVPPFTVVGGVPARPIHKRFPPEVEAAVTAAQWWLRPWPEIVEHLDLFIQDITPEVLTRFKAAFPPAKRTVPEGEGE